MMATTTNKQPPKRARRSTAATTTTTITTDPQEQQRQQSPALCLDPLTSTPAMRLALQELQSSLVCPLCRAVFCNPSTLPGCGHTFCMSCMDEHSKHSWACPIPTCAFPLTLRGGREGSFLKTNPQVQTVVTSFSVICETLNRAPNEWWKEEDNDTSEDDDNDGQVVDFNQYSPCPQSLSRDEKSPAEDSEQTEAFARPPVVHHDVHSQATATMTKPSDNPSMSHHHWMSPIREETTNKENGRQENHDHDDDGCSCVLPSQSPNCSPIAHMASQTSLTTHTDHRAAAASAIQSGQHVVDTMTERAVVRRDVSKSHCCNETNTAVVEEKQRLAREVPPPDTNIPTVLVASALSPSDSQLLDELVDARQLKVVTPNDDDDDECTATTATAADFCVCANAEFASSDGFLLSSRTYGYLLAVARGLAVVNISFLVEHHETNKANKNAAQDQSNKNGVGIVVVANPPDGNHSRHQVIGISADDGGGEWMAPQRAIKARQQQEGGGGNKETGTMLLQGYRVLLIGDFDSLVLPRSSTVSSSYTAATTNGKKRFRHGADVDNSLSCSVYTYARLERLMRSCGGNIVSDLDSLVESVLRSDDEDYSKVAVMLRPKPHPRDWRAARKELEASCCPNNIPLISADWLLDSIGDFRVKAFDEYTQHPHANVGGFKR